MFLIGFMVYDLWRGLCPGIDLAGRWRWSLAALAQWLRRCALRSGSLMIAGVLHGLCGVIVGVVALDDSGRGFVGGVIVKS